MEELGRWTKMSDTERALVGSQLADRQEAYRKDRESTQ
tara:strand:- start:2181 stop:2294 length:114 start_codon:yes stop_codon:yes gene_type:complete